VNVSCFDWKRFDAIPTRRPNPNDQARERQSSSLQRPWDAWRRHAPCVIPIPELWGMDCLCGRLDGEGAYVRALWTLTASNPVPPEAVVSLELVRYDRPLVPYRWPISGRPTVYPESEFSRRGYLSVAGEDFCGRQRICAIPVEPNGWPGGPGRFAIEMREEYKNRCGGVLMNWDQV
jgi:hypothetical protein